jgi:hypothetical protein
MSVELEGASKAIHDYDTIARKLREPGATLRHESKLIERAERGVFASLAGRYVATGRVMRSLTESEGADAVRESTPEGFEFGTRVEYARYLTEHVGPETPKGGLKRPLPVAVLKLTETTARQIASDALHEITGQGSSTGLVSSYLGGTI